MSWFEARRQCSKLPRLPHFGPPVLATLDVNRHQMNNLLKNTMMKIARCSVGYWTGGYIPAQYGNNINEFRWLSDNSRLKTSHPVWHPNNWPRQNAKPTCALLDCYYKNQTVHNLGMWNEECRAKGGMLCHYKVDESHDGACHLPPVPQNAHLSSKYQVVFPEGKVVLVICNHGYVLKAGPHRKIQSMLCVHGSWTPAQDCI